MGIGVTLFILAILIIAIWVIVEVKRMRHKLFAIFLIALILFSYFSFTIVLKGEDVNLKTVPGIIKAGDLYITWLGYMLGNLKSISTYAFKKDWKIDNNTIEGLEDS
jgi:hypothetical protein